MANALLHFFVGLLFWPFAVPVGVILGFLYKLYPTALVNGFLKYGGYIAAPGFDIKSVQIDGMNISYMDRPAKDDSQPTLVFLHGITGQKLAWIPLLRQLPSSWRIVALDLPGHGESDFSEDLTYCVDLFVDILHKVFVTLDLNHFHIIGESLGSICSGHYAYIHPERLASMTVISPAAIHRIGAKCSPTMAYFEGQVNNQKNPILPETADEFRNMLKLVLHQPQGLFWPNHMLEAVVSIHSQHYPKFEKVIRDMRSNGETDEIIRSRVEKAKYIPTLVVWGQQDQVCDVSGAKLLKKLAPQSKVVILNNCGHCVSIEKPKKCAQLIDQFITKQISKSVFSL